MVEVENHRHTGSRFKEVNIFLLSPLESQNNPNLLNYILSYCDHQLFTINNIDINMLSNIIFRSTRNYY